MSALHIGDADVCVPVSLHPCLHAGDTPCLPRPSPRACCPPHPALPSLLARSEREKLQTDTMFETDNTGIDFDAYEDIPVEVR
jgi:hypothetical protein